MGWFRKLGKDYRGSRPRCLLMVDGNREEVASRLTRLVNLHDVVVSPNDKWIPCGKPVLRDGSWDKTPALEIELDKPNDLVCGQIQLELKTWWLAVSGKGRGARTLNWDIASTCTVRGQCGLLLIEAKAHTNELDIKGKPLKECASQNSQENHNQIGRAIVEASDGLALATGRSWGLSRDHHYQLSNRFAWSWKLASLGIPVVLLYLGFLNAQEMVDRGPMFRSEMEWARALKEHSHGVVDGTCWGEWLDIAGTPFIALIKGKDQLFDSNCT